jgi:hypothetical protein
MVLLDLSSSVIELCVVASAAHPINNKGMNECQNSKNTSGNNNNGGIE